MTYLSKSDDDVTDKLQQIEHIQTETTDKTYSDQPLSGSEGDDTEINEEAFDSCKKSNNFNHVFSKSAKKQTAEHHNIVISGH